MRPLFDYYLNFLIPLLLGGFLYVFGFQSGRASHPPGELYAPFESALGLAIGVLAIWSSHADRSDGRLEYLWSLPIRPRSIFYLKFMLCCAMLSAWVALHFGLEVSGLLRPEEAGVPLQFRWHAVRLHPVVQILFWFPLTLCFLNSSIGRRLPLRVCWPLALLLPVYGPWMALASLPIDELRVQFDPSLYPISAPPLATLIEQYSHAQVANTDAWRGLWWKYLGFALIAGPAALLLAERGVVARELAPENSSEE